MGCTNELCPAALTGWKARLKLSAIGGSPRTRVWKEHQGPLYLQRPFYPEEDGTAHLYLLHPPGGVVGGDEIDIRIELQEQAALLVTTPGCGKFYRSAGQTAIQHQQFDLGSDTVLEWFPQETILYEQSRTALSTQIHLQKGARYTGWEILCFGRPASGHSFGNGVCHQRLEIWQGCQPLWIDRAVFDGADEMLQSSWGLGGYSVFGTMVSVLPDKALGQPLIALIRSTICSHDGELFAVTLCDSVLICRYLGHVAEKAKQHFTDAWNVIRQVLLQKEAVIPRIWKT